MAKRYKYKGSIYSNDYWNSDKNAGIDGDLDDLLQDIADESNGSFQIITCTYYVLNGEEIANENNLDAEELVEELYDDGYFEDDEFEIEEN